MTRAALWLAAAFLVVTVGGWLTSAATDNPRIQEVTGPVGGTLLVAAIIALVVALVRSRR